VNAGSFRYASAPRRCYFPASKPAVRPGRAVTLVVALLLAAAAALIAVRSRLLSWGGAACPLVRLGAWTLCGVFSLRALGNFDTFGFFKVGRATAFARYDTFLFSPLCLTIGVGCLVVALGP
jgi:hypothetical protein